MTGKQVKTKPESVCEKTPVFESGFVRYISKMCGSLIHALTNHNTFTIIFSKVTKSNQRKQMPIPHIRINKDLTCMSTMIITSDSKAYLNQLTTTPPYVIVECIHRADNVDFAEEQASVLWLHISLLLSFVE